MRLGVLTGGGDCPGLNAAIRAVVRKAVHEYGAEVFGFLDGWRGAIEGHVLELGPPMVRGILPRGGSILGSSGANPVYEGRMADVHATVRDLGVDGIVAIGGEGTLTAAAKLAADGVPVVGVPKTIDNDVAGTDHSIGFQTAVQIATEAIDRLHTTAETHDRLMLVEVMGRASGWIAVEAGIAGGADMILVPERPFVLDEVCTLLRRRHLRGHDFSIVVVAEGASPEAGGFELPDYPVDERGFTRFGGIAHALAPQMATNTGWETRVTVLGHVQRGGTPVAADRVLATVLGTAAVDLVAAGRFGTMVGVRSRDVVTVPLDEVALGARGVPDSLLAAAAVFYDV
jgi:ATP-dependent phosphofructokinase / diphosphate-dependent phosphofructokinase